MVDVPSLVAAKLALHDAMPEQGVGNVELAARLRLDEKTVRRLRALGRRLVVGVAA